VMFRAILNRPRDSAPAPAELLNLIATALIIATADSGDGKPLKETLDELGR